MSFLGSIYKNLIGIFSPPISIGNQDSPLGSKVFGGNLYYEYMRQRLNVAKTRTEQYKDAATLDNYGMITALLDTYSEDITQVDIEVNRAVWVTSDNEELKDILHDMFDVVAVEDWLYPVARSMLKFGDRFDYVYAKPRVGVYRTRFISPMKINRIEDDTGELKGWQITNQGIATTQHQAQDKRKQDIIPPWRVLHYRNSGKDEESVYGSPLTQGCEKEFNALEMSTESMIYYRLRRLPERDVHYIPTGKASIRESFDIVNRYKEEYRRNRFIKATGNQSTYDFKASPNPLSASEDIFVPVPEGQESVRIERQQGASAPDEIYDIDFLLDRFLACARIPREYFGFESRGGQYDSSKSLLQQDMRYTRKCKRMQRPLKSTLIRLCKIHMAYLGIDPTLKENAFELHMTPISYLEEAQRKDLVDMRVDILDRLGRIGMDANIDTEKWYKYILQRYGGFTEEDVALFYNPQPGEEVEFEDLSAKEKQKLEEEIAKDPELKEAIEKIKNLRKKRANSMSSAHVQLEEETLNDIRTLVNEHKNGNGKDTTTHKNNKQVGVENAH